MLRVQPSGRLRSPDPLLVALVVVAAAVVALVLAILQSL
jgi:hypothetical protein